MHAHFDHVASLDELSQGLPQAEVVIGEREARFLEGDFSLRPGEQGKRLFDFKSVEGRAHPKSQDGEAAGSLRSISSPGHSPGHFSYFDVRDKTLIAGDAFMNADRPGGCWRFPVVFSHARVVFLEWRFMRPQRGKASRSPAGSGCRWTRRQLLNPAEAMEKAVALAFSATPGCARSLKETHCQKRDAHDKLAENLRRWSSP